MISALCFGIIVGITVAMGVIASGPNSAVLLSTEPGWNVLASNQAAVWFGFAAGMTVATIKSSLDQAQDAVKKLLEKNNNVYPKKGENAPGA